MNNPCNEVFHKFRSLMKENKKVVPWDDVMIMQTGIPLTSPLVYLFLLKNIYVAAKSLKILKCMTL